MKLKLHLRRERRGRARRAVISRRNLNPSPVQFSANFYSFYNRIAKQTSEQLALKRFFAQAIQSNMATTNGQASSSGTSVGTILHPHKTTHHPTNSHNTAQSPAQAKFELGVTLILHSWPALTVAVKEEWGGPDSADKRDWFAGVIVDLFHTNPLTDAEDLEDFLAQVMEDEFELVLDDESEVQTASQIMAIRKQCGKGEFATVDQMYEQWKVKKDAKVQISRAGPGSDDEGDSVDEESEEDDEDVEMGDAPAQPKEKPPPEIDEDGFTKVVGKKRR